MTPYKYMYITNAEVDLYVHTGSLNWPLILFLAFITIIMVAIINYNKMMLVIIYNTRCVLT